MRRSERLLAGYFVYTAVLAWVLAARPPVPALLAVLNLTILGTLVLAAYAYSFRHSELLGIMRDWFALSLLLLSYREAGWFARAHAPRLENAFIVWDRALLRDWGARAAIESIGPVLPAILEIAYALVYALVPFGVTMLYVYRQRKRVDAFLFPVLLGVLLCYVQFPFWPSEPPRAVFPGEDFPTWNTIFRRFNWWMLSGQGIHTSVFPSAHVAGSFSAAFAMMRTLPEHRWVGRFLLVMAVLIATATVYGRYHYLADALAGFTMCLLAIGINRWVERRRVTISSR